jgi:hypothetical protein
MKRSLKALLATATLLAGIEASDAAVRIMDDPSGGIGTYVNRYKGMRISRRTLRGCPRSNRR